ncbi:MAG TPA: hypothetical protein ENI05_12080 [Porticoccus sp.]|nr:hypothetical protein [Porticoccus sp.]
MLRKTFKWLAKVYCRKKIMWSPGYFVSSVGIDKKAIKNYVDHPLGSDHPIPHPQ